VFLGFIYTLAVTAILLSLRYLKKANPTTLGNLRSSLESIQNEIQQLHEQIWHYGSTEEEISRRWKIACVALAGKAVAALQSCWLGREQDTASRAVYDELLMSLKSVGVEEITPGVGDQVEENDRRYRIRKKEGSPPYKVSRVLCPGYYFKPTLGKASEDQEKIILEPALIEVESERVNNKIENLG